MNPSNPLITFEASNASVALPVLPIQSPYSVDPATAAAVIEAAIAFLKDEQTGNWQASVGAKLNLILAKLDEIVRLLNEATYEIIRSNNENWQDYFAANIQGPGQSWEYYASDNHRLSEREVDTIVRAFTDRLAPAVHAITMHDRYRSWGFTLVDVVRIAFSYSLLALKLAGARLSARTIKAEVGQHVLKYLKRSISSDPSEPHSFAHHLYSRRATYVEQLAKMEAWCNGWVRISIARTRFAGRGGSESELYVWDDVLVAHILGGAMQPTVREVRLVRDSDALFYSKPYPDFPDNIGANEREKAIDWCQRTIAEAISQREKLAQLVSLLEKTISTISADIGRIEAWMQARD